MTNNNNKDIDEDIDKDLLKKIYCSRGIVGKKDIKICHDILNKMFIEKNGLCYSCLATKCLPERGKQKIINKQK